MGQWFKQVVDSKGITKSEPFEISDRDEAYFKLLQQLICSMRKK